MSQVIAITATLPTAEAETDAVPRIETSHAVRTNDGSRLFGIRKSALIEMFTLLALITLCDRLFGDNGTRLFAYTYHPFWAVMLLVLVQYGLPEALACAAMSSMFLLDGNLPQQQITETFYDYFLHLGRLPFMWLLVAVIGGEIRKRQINEKELLAEKLKQATIREKAVASEYVHLKKAKEKLEVRVSEESFSVARAYKAASALQSLDELSLMSGLKHIIGDAIQPEKFSLFFCYKESIALVASHGWQENEQYVRNITADSLLYTMMADAKKTLCVTQPEDEAVLAGEGVMAAPIFDPRTGKFYGMVKIEKIAFARLTFSTLHALTHIAQWAGMAISNARAYQKKTQKVTLAVQHPQNSHSGEKRTYSGKTAFSKIRHVEPAA
jgi:hypothetical protein